MKDLLPINLKSFLLLISLLWSATLNAQQKAYFADGFHGGIYGHYPRWQTQFMVDKLNEFPNWKINLELEPETWDSVKVYDPTAYQNFAEALKQDGIKERIDFVNPSYGQSYLYNITGESVIRQFTFGMNHLWQHFPGLKFTTYSAEEPCFTSALPQILTQLGFQYAVLRNPDTCWGGYTSAYGGELVNWVGPDGTAIPTVPRYEIEGLVKGSTWQTESWNNSEEFIQASLGYGIQNPVGMCLQDAGWKGGPWLEGTIKDYYKPSEYTTWSHYIDNVAKDKINANWHVNQEDMLVSLVWGAQVLQRIARQVRTAENQLVSAEKMATMASLTGNYQWPEASFHEAWRTLLLSQHHDCWIVPYNGKPGDTWADKVVDWTGTTTTNAEKVVNQSATVMQGAVENTGNYVSLYNTLGVERAEVVEIPIPKKFSKSGVKVMNKAGEALPIQQTGSSVLISAEIPAAGYKTFSFQKAGQQETQENKMAALNTSGEVVLESDMYKITIDPKKGGTIRSFILKTMDGQEIIDPEKEFRFNEIRGHFFQDGKFYSSTQSPATVEILEQGPLRAKVKVSGKIQEHPFDQMITLTQGNPKVDVDLTIHWQGDPGIGAYDQSENYKAEDREKAFYNDMYKLQVLFPTTTSNERLFKNAPFDVMESENSSTFFDSWDQIKHNVILNWVDVFDEKQNLGLALFSDHTTSYLHAPDYPLGLTVQFSGKGLWGRNYTITQPTEISYAIMPHQKMWDEAGIWQQGNQWSEKVMVKPSRKVNNDQWSLLDLADTGWELSSMTMDGEDMLVRFFNASGEEGEQKIKFNCKADQISEADLLGNAIKVLATDPQDGATEITLGIPRFGIKTLRLKAPNL